MGDTKPYQITTSLTVMNFVYVCFFLQQTETACEYDQQHEHGQSLTQDADCDEGIQDQKP